MAWRAVHPRSTKEVQCPAGEDGAPRFEIGFWPPAVAERLDVRMTELRKQSKNADAAVVCEMVKYGVRGWSGMVGDDEREILDGVVEEEIDGRKHPVLIPECIELLRVNRLLELLAVECFEFNTLSDRKKRPSSSPSNSAPLIRPTGAGSVVPEMTDREDLNGSSASTASPSTGAPTT